ncbi:heme/hemin ABC transporter substrate-binding protein [Chitinimonas sp. BJB300]|uniref:heme/hemin ABC transporter substrate-binding protein n=1 Tax=Chitinimonas sp. BJB300 TaxID=1559339 RepID=UPI000C0DDAE7|nr:ABC transporter substrate-binding protein [Chitinimonas sp. BJB300]PHV12412.1 ABC transporter substrate-binding protein [Chitinimonas sp. BJB300]TSJ89010.1 ABC transporter substrate-binding protein [Chitinimonas sp. BJB300]
MLHRHVGSALLLSLLISTPALTAERIVVLTADVAEILVALGKADEVVGRDRSAKLPALAKASDIGLSRSLSAEPILRLKPSLVIGSRMALPTGIWGQLNGFGLRAVQVSNREDGADYADTIRNVGNLVGASAAANKLAVDWNNAMQPASPMGKRVLISYEGKTFAGRDTPGDTLIRAAGAINAADGVVGYKPLDAEAIAKLAPDVILVAEHNKAVYGGIDQLKNRADIASTPAGKNGKVFEIPAHEFFSVNLGSPAAVKKLKGMS